MPVPEQDSGSSLGWWLFGIIAFFGFVAVISASDNGAPADSANREVIENPVANDTVAEQMAPVPLDKNSVERGQIQLKAVARLGLSDATKIFSQNCYEALDQKFDWHQLDRCGSFDALARRWAEAHLSTSDQELSWFQSETAAARYLTAATSNGLPPGEADVRWAEIELSSGKQILPATEVSKVAESLPVNAPSEDDVLGDQENATELGAENRLD